MSAGARSNGTDRDRMTGYFIHPFDDDRFIAGNATAGLEIIEDLPDVDAIVAPIGGGGLLAGIAASVRALNPNVRVYAAEPETAAPLSASLAAGRPVAFDDWRASFVDGAGGKSVLETMWPLLSRPRRIDRRVARRCRRRDEAGRRARPRHRGRRRRGARSPPPSAAGAGGGKVVAVVSGGNIDLARFASLVGACDAARHPSSLMNRFASLAPFPRGSRGSTSSPSTSGGAGIRAREVFRRLDYPLWRTTAHNPVRMLRTIPASTLDAAAADPEFLRVYDRAIDGARRRARPRTTPGGRARCPHLTGQRSPTSPLSSRSTSRCRSTRAGSACWPAITARKPATSACRSSASGSCIRRATSTSTSRLRAGRKRATSG